MKKLFFISTALLFSTYHYAQVGINTDNPHTSLDVNGSIQLRKELRVNGNPGEPGEIYFSKGNIDEPEWKEVNVPFLEEGQYQLINTYAIADEVGIDFTGAVTTPVTVFNETFENSSSTVGQWTQVKEQGTSDWTFGTGAGSGNITSAHGGTRNARFVRGTTTQRTKLVSPVLDFSDYASNLTLGFWYGQQEETASCFTTYRANNTLTVFYRTSADGVTWTAWSQVSNYTTAANAWTEVSNLTLPNSAGKQYYQIAFEGETKWTSYNNFFCSGTVYGYPNVLDDVIIKGSLPNSNSYNSALSSIGETITAKNWTKIPGLDLPITIGNDDNKISVVFQTGVESRMNTGGGNQTAGNIKYTCGLFQRQASQPESSATLVAVRGNQINNTVNKPNADKSQSVFTLTYTVDDTPAGDYIYSVACRRLSLTGGGGSETTSLLSIGNSVNSGNNVTNDFMLGSILKMDIIELVTVTGL